MAVSFIGEENRSTQRKLPTSRKSLTVGLSQMSKVYRRFISRKLQTMGLSRFQWRVIGACSIVDYRRSDYQR